MRIRLILALCSLVLAAPKLSAQDARTPLRAAVADAMRRAPLTLPRTSQVLPPVERRGMPTWVKWGLVGAAAGAVIVPTLGWQNVDGTERSLSDDVIAGAILGFVIVGGSIKLYQFICGETSAQRRAGMCG